MFYIFNQQGECLVKTAFPPDEEDLTSRGETAVTDDTDYDLASIVLLDGRITLKPVIPPTLEETKAAKWREIKGIRNGKEQAGCPYMGKIFDTDPISVQRIAMAVLSAQTIGQAFKIAWTMQDNTVITMTAEDVCGMPVALAMYSNNLHQTARRLREQTDAAATAEEVAAIEWPGEGA